MRPVRRNASPVTQDYSDYADAKTDLISRIGSGYCRGIHLASCCSYCERKIDTNLAVEHIEPKKGIHGQPQLEGHWTNFLLACVNCNSTKGDKQVVINDLYFPDRDNTFYAFEYLADGNIQPRRANDQIAAETLKLTGLDKAMRQTLDAEDRLIAEDRSSQRMQAWKYAEISLEDYNSNLSSETVKHQIVGSAITTGFFSIWMTVFENISEMQNRFIDAFSGTRESGCFTNDATPITPAPNPDGLQSGGKI